MINKEQLREMFEAQLKLLPTRFKDDLRIEFNVGNSLHGFIDLIIYKGSDCMALGFFQESVQANSYAEKQKLFSNRFNRAMGYHVEPWYLFGFNGHAFVINDLSLNRATDEFPSSVESGLRRLCTIPKQWHAEMKLLEDMQRYLNTIRDMISEGSFSKNVN